ncbi:hypothetical protein LSAT2_013053, partial [Lamellibrachia satsuma]
MRSSRSEPSFLSASRRRTSAAFGTSLSTKSKRWRLPWLFCGRAQDAMSLSSPPMVEAMNISAMAIFGEESGLRKGYNSSITVGI